VMRGSSQFNVIFSRLGSQHLSGATL